MDVGSTSLDAEMKEGMANPTQRLAPPTFASGGANAAVWSALVSLTSLAAVVQSVSRSPRCAGVSEEVVSRTKDSRYRQAAEPREAIVRWISMRRAEAHCRLAKTYKGILLEISVI